MGMTTLEEQAELKRLRQAEADKCGPSDDPMTHCNMDGVCEKHSHIYEKPDETSSLTSDLYGLARRAGKLENDFKFQYDYNQALEAKLNKAVNDKTTLEGAVADLKGYLKEAAEQRDHLAQDREFYVQEYLRLKATDNKSLFWKLVAFVGWIFFLLLLAAKIFG